MDSLGYDVTNLQNLIFFLLPGLLTVLLFNYQVPDRRKTDFMLIALSVIASVFLTSITSLIFIVLNYAFQLDINSGTFWFEGTKILLSIVLAILLARFVRSGLFTNINKNILQVRSYPFGRLWNTFLRFDRPTALKVSLLDGSSYIGLFSKSSFNPNDDVQELELLDPYSFQKDKATVKKIQETERVLILGSAIATIEKITFEEAKKLYNLPQPLKRK